MLRLDAGTAGGLEPVLSGHAPCTVLYSTVQYTSQFEYSLFLQKWRYSYCTWYYLGSIVDCVRTLTKTILVRDADNIDVAFNEGQTHAQRDAGAQLRGAPSHLKSVVKLPINIEIAGLFDDPMASFFRRQPDTYSLRLGYAVNSERRVCESNSSRSVPDTKLGFEDVLTNGTGPQLHSSSDREQPSHAITRGGP
eukprot:389486-Prorocentrum_minimum.AAC.2